MTLGFQCFIRRPPKSISLLKGSHETERIYRGEYIKLGSASPNVGSTRGPGLDWIESDLDKSSVDHIQIEEIKFLPFVMR